MQSVVLPRMRIVSRRDPENGANLSHRPDANTPVEETLGAYEALLKQGKVKAVGASNYSTQQLRQALDVASKSGLPPRRGGPRARGTAGRSCLSVADVQRRRHRTHSQCDEHRTS
jgi:hypothetical protein